MSATRTVAIIPARGGSSRIPRKNVLPLDGIPLIEHTIKQAKSASNIDRIIVSTDDSEISQIATRCAVEVVHRPKPLASGTATSEQALIHVLNHLKDVESYEAEELVFLQCTSPFRSPADIDNAISQFRQEKCDSLFSVAPFRKYLWRIEGGKVESINFRYETERWMEQEFPAQFEENGSIYVLKPWVLQNLGYRFGGKIGMYEMEEISTFQIDEPSDIEICEALLRAKKMHRGSCTNL